MILQENHNGLVYQVYLPPYPLSCFINFMVEIKGKPHFRFERILPDIRTELLFNLSEDVKGVEALGHTQKICKTVNLSGTRSSFFDSYPGRFFHVFVVEFKPEVLFDLFGVTAASLSNEDLEAALCIKNIHEIREQLLEAADSTSRFDLMIKWVGKLVWQSNHSPNKLTSWIKDQLAADINTRIMQLEKNSGYSRKHLHANFKQHVGISIKAYQEIRRFQQVISELKTSKSYKLTEVAHSLNYFDQSHFIKTFRKYTGLTPSQYISNDDLSGRNIPFSR